MNKSINRKRLSEIAVFLLFILLSNFAFNAEENLSEGWNITRIQERENPELIPEDAAIRNYITLVNIGLTRQSNLGVDSYEDRQLLIPIAIEYTLLRDNLANDVIKGLCSHPDFIQHNVAGITNIMEEVVSQEERDKQVLVSFFQTKIKEELGDEALESISLWINKEIKTSMSMGNINTNLDLSQIGAYFFTAYDEPCSNLE